MVLTLNAESQVIYTYGLFSLLMCAKSKGVDDEGLKPAAAYYKYRHVTLIKNTDANTPQTLGFNLTQLESFSTRVQSTSRHRRVRRYKRNNRASATMETCL